MALAQQGIRGETPGGQYEAVGTGRRFANYEDYAAYIDSQSYIEDLAALGLSRHPAYGSISHTGANGLLSDDPNDLLPGQTGDPYNNLARDTNIADGLDPDISNRNQNGSQGGPLDIPRGGHLASPLGSQFTDESAWDQFFGSSGDMSAVEQLVKDLQLVNPEQYPDNASVWEIILGNDFATDKLLAAGTIDQSYLDTFESNEGVDVGFNQTAQGGHETDPNETQDDFAHRAGLTDAAVELFKNTNRDRHQIEIFKNVLREINPLWDDVDIGTFIGQVDPAPSIVDPRIPTTEPEDTGPLWGTMDEQNGGFWGGVRDFFNPPHENLGNDPNFSQYSFDNQTNRWNEFLENSGISFEDGENLSYFWERGESSDDPKFHDWAAAEIDNIFHKYGYGQADGVDPIGSAQVLEGLLGDGTPGLGGTYFGRSNNGTGSNNLGGNDVTNQNRDWFNNYGISGYAPQDFGSDQGRDPGQAARAWMAANPQVQPRGIAPGLAGAARQRAEAAANMWAVQAAMGNFGQPGVDQMGFGFGAGLPGGQINMQKLITDEVSRVMKLGGNPRSGQSSSSFKDFIGGLRGGFAGVPGNPNRGPMNPEGAQYAALTEALGFTNSADDSRAAYGGFAGRFIDPMLARAPGPFRRMMGNILNAREDQMFNENPLPEDLSIDEYLRTISQGFF